MSGHSQMPPLKSRNFLFFRPIFLLGAMLAGMVWWGWYQGYFEGWPKGTIFLLLLGGVWNVFLFALFLLVWRRITLVQTRREFYNSELRHLASLSGEEGKLRKVGLIKELNTLGSSPEKLENAELDGADLKGADLSGCNMKGANLKGADLQGANLDRADLSGADFSSANLTMTTLNGANARGCNLENANLVKAELAGADLYRANLVDTNLYGTSLKNARLGKTRFAIREGEEFHQSVHSSVEDWIREKLDQEGFYNP